LNYEGKFVAVVVKEKYHDGDVGTIGKKNAVIFILCDRPRPTGTLTLRSLIPVPTEMEAMQMALRPVSGTTITLYHTSGFFSKPHLLLFNLPSICISVL